MHCPLCGEGPVVDDTCPGTCGSLEGLLVGDEKPEESAALLAQPPTGRLFGYAWSDGYVAPFVAVEQESAQRALAAAQLSSLDILIDLGCGDGRVCRLAATRHGAKAVGVDLDETLLRQAREKMAAAGSETTSMQANCSSLVSFIRQDLFQVCLASYTVVVVFLLPETLTVLAPRLRKFLHVGSSEDQKRRRRVISFGWPIPNLGTPPVKQSIPPTTSSATNYSGLVTRWFIYCQAVLLRADAADTETTVTTTVATPNKNKQQ